MTITHGITKRELGDCGSTGGLVYTTRWRLFLTTSRMFALLRAFQLDGSVTVGLEHGKEKGNWGAGRGDIRCT